MPFLLLTTIMASLAVGSVNAQRSYLDEVLEPASKAKAAYYLDPGGKDGQGGFLAHIYTLDGVLKADGRYMDAEYRVADGHFVFYYPNGKVESEGDYQKGRKNGVWQRNDKWGRELAEKVYDAAPLKNLVYTLAQTMPQYPGGDKALVRYVRDKVGKTHGDVMASFIVEKDGQLSDVQVVGAEDPRTADQIAGVINSLPPWQAGVQDGQPVRVQMRVPLK
ncbi:MAG TPA: energy transducer TonB [Flavobacteriales bacterium]|nr:energy transducer TonB [Flavobacteriales bacterium]MBK7248805.1 energy transducer TonB [Flavobacteriales bacterium]MBK7288104.1 energy transducer TonB [Flavobacteriales bacterium]QQS74050.1 MAG: energy transducer TonB [Flavobacteriales bacterium]HQV38628.1 energy transducer TonB [Flavobacteriales bacterium]